MNTKQTALDKLLEQHPDHSQVLDRIKDLNASFERIGASNGVTVSRASDPFDSRHRAKFLSEVNHEL